jgi:hypothetical protein
MNRLVTFDTTHHALWAEEVAREKGLAVEVVPAPEGTSAKCGMALECLEESFEDLQAVLAQEGIAFKVYA